LKKTGFRMTFRKFSKNVQTIALAFTRYREYIADKQKKAVPKSTLGTTSVSAGGS